MLLAQKLYESGKITYMRTDSVNLSDTAMDAIKRKSTKLWQPVLPVEALQNKMSAQEAHEAIRPPICKTIPWAIRN